MTPHHVRCFVLAGAMVMPLARGVVLPPSLWLTRRRTRETNIPERAASLNSATRGSPRKPTATPGKNRRSLLLPQPPETGSLADMTMAGVEPELRDLKPIREAANELGCSTRSIYNWIKRGYLEEYKTPGGGKRLVDVEELRRKLRP